MLCCVYPMKTQAARSLRSSPSYGECFLSLLVENQGCAIIPSSVAAARTLGASFVEAVYLSGVFLVKYLPPHLTL